MNKREFYPERIARGAGWLDAYDDLDGTLVVYHEEQGIHFSGPSAWDEAARFSAQKSAS